MKRSAPILFALMIAAWEGGQDDTGMMDESGMMSDSAMARDPTGMSGV